MVSVKTGFSLIPQDTLEHKWHDRASLTFRQGGRPSLFHASRSLTESTLVESGERYSLPGKVLPFGPGQFSVLLSPAITANRLGVHQPEEGIWVDINSIQYNRVELF